MKLHIVKWKCNLRTSHEGLRTFQLPILIKKSNAFPMHHCIPSNTLENYGDSRIQWTRLGYNCQNGGDVFLKILFTLWHSKEHSILKIFRQLLLSSIDIKAFFRSYPILKIVNKQFYTTHTHITAKETSPRENVPILYIYRLMIPSFIIYTQTSI